MPMYENGRGGVVFTKHVEWTGREMVVKYGPGVRRTEAEVMRMVREKTSIPVPAVYSVDEHEGDLFIYQELLPGVPLLRFYSPNLQPGSHRHTQFLAYVTELHSLHAPPGIAMGLLGSTATNKLQRPKALDPRLGCDKEKLAFVNPSAPVVLTHCDLHAGNVFVSPDCTATAGIVDWERAAWLPEWADAHASAVHAEVDAWAGGGTTIHLAGALSGGVRAVFRWQELYRVFFIPRS